MNEQDKEREKELVKLRDAAIGDNPVLQQLQYKIDCRFSACKTIEEREEAFRVILEEHLQTLTAALLVLSSKTNSLVHEMEEVQDHIFKA